jgi:hypothetical protein
VEESVKKIAVATLAILVVFGILAWIVGETLDPHIERYE